MSVKGKTMTQLSSVQVLNVNNNVQGTFASASAPVPAGTKQIVLSLLMSSAALADTTNVLRLGLECDFGQGFVFQGWGPRWQGGPGQVNPSAPFAAPSVLPQRCRIIFENGLDGNGTEAPIEKGLITFNS